MPEIICFLSNLLFPIIWPNCYLSYCAKLSCPKPPIGSNPQLPQVYQGFRLPAIKCQSCAIVSLKSMKSRLPEAENRNLRLWLTLDRSASAPHTWSASWPRLAPWLSRHRRYSPAGISWAWTSESRSTGWCPCRWTSGRRWRRGGRAGAAQTRGRSRETWKTQAWEERGEKMLRTLPWKSGL